MQKMGWRHLNRPLPFQCTCRMVGLCRKSPLNWNPKFLLTLLVSRTSFEYLSTCMWLENSQQFLGSSFFGRVFWCNHSPVSLITIRWSFNPPTSGTILFDLSPQQQGLKPQSQGFLLGLRTPEGLQQPQISYYQVGYIMFYISHIIYIYIYTHKYPIKSPSLMMNPPKNGVPLMGRFAHLPRRRGGTRLFNASYSSGSSESDSKKRQDNVMRSTWSKRLALVRDWPKTSGFFSWGYTGYSH